MINTNIFDGMVIPDVLSNDDTEKYLELYKNGDMKAKNLLIKHNIRLVIYIARKYLNNCDSFNIDFEDLVMIGIEGLIKAINTYKFDKGVKISSYATVCINNEILLYLKKNKKHNNVFRLEEVINVDFDGNELKVEDVYGYYTDDYVECWVEVARKNKIREILNELDHNEREIIMLYYGFYDRVYQQKEIADVMGISQSYLSRKLKKIEMVLKRKLIKEKLY